MKKSILLAAVLAAVSTLAQADNTQAQKAVAVPAVTPAKPAQMASKAVRLSDAELDKITAGGATQIATGNGVTIILNPGKASVFKRHTHGLVCINLCF